MKTPVRSVALEEYGKDGWGCYRIPGIVTTANGTILAYYETRETDDDWSAYNIGLRRSTDGGMTFLERVLMVHNNEGNPVNNPVMIACKNGDVHFLWGCNYQRVFHCISRDDGATWTKPNEITAPMERYREAYAWTALALGPGHGIELDNGRLLVPVWLSNGGGRAHRPSIISTIFSDDGGQVWECGELLVSHEHLVNPNESSVAQLSDGRVMINIRNETDVRRRAVSISPDGARGWASPWYDQSLPDPICFGSLLRLRTDPHELVFLHCDTDGMQAKGGNESRTNLTVKYSADNGETWSRTLQVEDRAGYADIAASPDGGVIYCFYEQGWIDGSCFRPAALAFARVDRDSLVAGGQQKEPSPS